MRDTKRYCVYPFNYPYIDTDGYVALCCKNSDHKLPYHISEYSLEYIWNSPEMIEVRRQFEEGEEPKGCHKCYEPERNGIRSFRQKTLNTINRTGPVIDGTNFAPFEDNSIYAIDLRIGNVCNLACIMCFAGNSNRIYQQFPKMAEHFQWKPGRLEADMEKYSAKNYGWSDDPVAWNNIISGIDSNIRHVYLAGGEPFYLKNFVSSIQRISNISPNAKFVINTNATRLLRKKDLSKFEGTNINIRLSVDGWGKADEFTRQGTVWEEKLKVMDQYYDHFTIEAWDISANVFSVRHIPKLMDYLQERYPDTLINIRPVINKPDLLLSNIPKHFIEEALDHFRTYSNRNERIDLDHVINEMEKPYIDNPERKQKMKTFVDFYNKNGVVKLEEFDKELSDWLFK